MAWRTIIATVCLMTATACVAGGPLRVDPDRTFLGVEDVFNEVPAGAAGEAGLNIFIVHGMRANASQFNGSDEIEEGCLLNTGAPDAEGPALEADVRASIIRRLHLNPVAARRCVFPVLSDELPNLYLNGQALWRDEVAWRADAPVLEIAEHRSLDGERTVVFFAFNYWGMLARVKCAEIVMPDRPLMGETDTAAFCRRRYEDLNGETVEPSSRGPLSVNRDLKTELVTWGFSDAVLAGSDMREVIRAALREAMARQVDFVRMRAGRGEAPETPLNEATAPQVVQSLANQRWVVITKSLGSYLALDALAPGSGVEAPLTEASRRNDRTQSAILTLCGANQIHMLANQVRLLRLAEVRLGEETESAPPRDVDRVLEQRCTAEDPNRARPLQIVAYHDPNDLLTFPLPIVDNPQMTTTNVIAPFAPIIVPFFVADAATAHDGQKVNGRIMDLVVHGRE